MINREQIFPLTLIALDLAAAGVYSLDAHWRLSIYWTAAAILTICVTFEF